MFWLYYYLFSRNGGYILQNRDSLNASRFYGPPWNEYLDCPWNTTDIETCLTRNWAYKDFRKTCDAHTNDAALKCRTDEYPGKRIKSREITLPSPSVPLFVNKYTITLFSVNRKNFSFGHQWWAVTLEHFSDLSDTYFRLLILWYF